MNRIVLNRAVDGTLAMPLYHQVYLILKQNIREGTYGPGAALPIEQQLCDSFKVSRITIKRAMQQLAAEGLIVRQRGRGTFVSWDNVSDPQLDALDDLIQNVLAIGAATQVRKLDKVMIVPPKEIQAKLKTEREEKVLKVTQVRTDDGEPIAVITAYVPIAVAVLLKKEKDENLPMLAQLQEAGVPLSRADQAITATLADPITASHLDVSVGVPMIRLSRLVFNNVDHPVEWLTALYRADRYEYRTSLTHDTSGTQSSWRSIETPA